MLFKKGDRTSMDNYRPIAIISILLKLFSRVLAARLSVYLEPQQSVDQAGFRKGFGCDDNLFALTALVEAMLEWRVDLWLATVDFRKAFDSVYQSAIWRALAEQGVPAQYISLVKRLYVGQTGIVALDINSIPFPISRGTKQGDPLSSLLFNAVLESIMRILKSRWSISGIGINVGEHPSGEKYLQNLRFADDVLLTANSKPDVVRMLEDLNEVAQLSGLHVHFGKTFILSTKSHTGSVLIYEHAVQVLDAQASAIYLGRALCMADWHSREIENRVTKAWASFHSLRKVLCSRTYPLRHRLSLFEQVVTATLLYGSASWTMTAARSQLIRSVQRSMLRRVVGTARQDEETYVDWIQRSTHVAESLYVRNGGESWVRQQRRRYWRWAGHVARAADGRWSNRLLCWHPQGSRRPGRPIKRWTDELDAFFSQQMGSAVGEWVCNAMDREGWKSWQEDFVRMCVL